MVAVDAFSQALSNPLLSTAVFNAASFSTPGWDAIKNTSSLADILYRNCPAGTAKECISMTWDGWKT
jgi:prostaglandin-endoperoxide synthase 2